MALRVLNRKLLRDLRGIRGQALAIAAVIAAGVALFVLMHSTFDSLDVTRRTYYERYRFADVFAACKRAPLWLRNEIAAIPDVSAVETRVVVDVTLDVPGLDEPALGRLISRPLDTPPVLNEIYLRSGRDLRYGRPDEVLAAESFATAHGLKPGDTVAAIINGRKRSLTIVGIALSPEYVYQIRPGEIFPDDKRFGVFWMEQRALATAFDMEGGFNDVSLRVAAGIPPDDAMARLDRLLRPYGGTGAIPRSLQVSNWYLTNELSQLETWGTAVPIVFLGVAAFLLNVVLSRIVSLQREQIAVLKAMGYSNRAVALHYLGWAVVVAMGGTVGGVALGAWFGAGMTRMYAELFHFPFLIYRLQPALALQAAGISLAAAVLGAVVAVRRAVTLPPAEAMRPAAPATFKPSLFERAGLGRVLSEPGRIILRTLQRHPGRAALSVIGMALGCSLLVVGNFMVDSIAAMVDVQFNVAQRYDVMVSFVEPTSASALDEAGHLPGVVRVEGFRSVPVRLRFGHRSRHTVITGVTRESKLYRVVDSSGQIVDVPTSGLVVSRKLAELLHAGLGSSVTVEVLEGRRPVLSVPIVRLIEDYVGVNAYMDASALRRELHEGDTLSGVYLAVDRRRVGDLYHRLKRTPRVAGVMLKEAAVQSFEDTFAEMMAQVRYVYLFFATVIAFGVVYNSARISLSERSRELATLRVIGFSRGEIAYILLGELAIVTLAAIPLGLVAGWGMAAGLVASMSFEAWRMPLVISSATYVISAVSVAVAALISALVVRRKLDRLDLVSVLKTRE